MVRAIKLIDAPIGLFEVDGILVLKTEYSTRHEDGTITPDCYIIESGEYFWGGVDSAEERNNLEVARVDTPTITPPNEPLTCEGCAEIGKWENEYEYGYPSPCTRCKRRAWDNYRRQPEGEA